VIENITKFANDDYDLINIVDLDKEY